jgi:dihydrofolate reductase
VQQYLRAGLVDEMHLVLSPKLLGAGENLFAGLDLPALGYRRVDHRASAAATHLIISKE